MNILKLYCTGSSNFKVGYPREICDLKERKKLISAGRRKLKISQMHRTKSTQNSARKCPRQIGFTNRNRLVVTISPPHYNYISIATPRK